MFDRIFSERILRKGRRHRRKSVPYRPAVLNLEDRTLLSFVAPLTQDFRGNGLSGRITTGDFLGNHIQDLAVTSGSTVSILLGNGDGTFQPPLTVPVGANAFALAAADLTHSGHDDLVITHANEGPGGSVSVLLSNGDGTFRPPVDYPAGDNPHSIALGDFTGRGVPDIVVANEGFFAHDVFQPGTTVTVLLNNGDGTFGAPRTFDTGVIPEDVAVGDFTGDGRISIVTADNGFTGIPSDISLLRGNGNGTFQEPVSLNVGPDGVLARSLAVGDLTGSGHLDIVAATYGPGGGVSVILGNGNGTFRSAVTYAATLEADTSVLQVVLGDFNGDGRPDIAVETGFGDAPGVDILVNNGDGTFQPPAEILGGPQGPLAAGDFTGDGISSLALAGGLGGIAIFLRQPGGLLRAPTVLATGPGTSSLQTADLRHDNTADLIVTNAQQNTVGVILGNGDGTFQPLATYAVGNNPQQVITADLLQNGIPDLVSVNQGDQSLSVLLGNGDGTFQDAQTIPLDAPSSLSPVRVVAGDFERNGTIDLVVLELDNRRFGGGGGLILLHGHGDGTFTQDPLQPINQPVSDPPGRITFQAADLAGDGNLDLLLSTFQFASVVIFPGHGDGTFGAAQFVNLRADPQDDVTSFALADLRGNGVLDLVVGVFDLFRRDDVIVALGNGDGTFQPGVRYQAAGAVNSLAVGDFNGDGIPDVAVSQQGLLGGAGSLNSLSVLSGNGDGTFGPPTNYAVPGEGLVTADFNGDGAPDLANFLGGSGHVSIVFNANDGTAPARRAAGRLPHHAATQARLAQRDATLGQAVTQTPATPRLDTTAAPVNAPTLGRSVSAADAYFATLADEDHAVVVTNRRPETGVAVKPVRPLASPDQEWTALIEGQQPGAFSG
jgi:hypothetical protein